MKIPENILQYIKSEAENIHHGRIILEINETSNNIDVISEGRERFARTESPQRQERTGEPRRG